MGERAAHPPTAGARGLLDRLRSVEFSLDADRRLLRRLEEAREKAAPGSERGRRPVRSPEAAEEERHLASSLAELAAGGLPELRERIADGAGRRHRVLEEMAESGYFEGRWVGEGYGAVYLERTAEPDAEAGAGDNGRSGYEVHRGPWEWVEDAPPGEDPRETLRRGEILARSATGRREFFVLLGVPFLVVLLAPYAQPLIPPVYLPILLAVVVVPLFVYLRRGRQRLLDTLLTTDDARRRKAEELAASKQIEIVRRGVPGRPRLEELIREQERELDRKVSVRGQGKIVLKTQIATLRHLEEAGIVRKASDEPPLGHYEITPRGESELRALVARASHEDPGMGPPTEAQDRGDKEAGGRGTC